MIEQVKELYPELPCISRGSPKLRATVISVSTTPGPTTVLRFSFPKVPRFPSVLLCFWNAATLNHALGVLAPALGFCPATSLGLS